MEDLLLVWLRLRSHIDQLASEGQQYRDVFEQAAEAYVVTDPDGTIQEANGPAVDLLQRRRQHLRGKPLAALMALERRAAFRERLTRLCGGDASAGRAWTTIIESPGLRTEVSITARVIRGAAEPRGVCWRLDGVQ